MLKIFAGLLTLTFAWERNGMTYTDGKYCPNVTMSSDSSVASMEHMRWVGVDWIALVTTWYSKNQSTIPIFPIYDEPFPINNDQYYEYKTAKDEDIIFAIHKAQELGMKVLLKPHIDLMDVNRHVIWRGNIGANFTDTEWSEWFKEYETFILHYAHIAEQNHVASLSVSCELIEASKQEAHWRSLIKKIRKVYSGELTDAANWSYEDQGESMEKKWWDAVDIIGIDAYYNTTQNGHEGWDQVLDNWKPIYKKLEGLHHKWKKNLMFTEVGYCPGNDCSRYGTPTEKGQDMMAMMYKALIYVWKDVSWFKGAFWWNWTTDNNFGGMTNACMDPKFKPAADVLHEYYGGSKGPRPEKTGPAKCLCTL